MKGREGRGEKEGGGGGGGGGGDSHINRTGVLTISFRG